jgi:spermidine synthase
VPDKLLYAVTIFVSAFLLFQVQPMIAKMILPWFGGAASVWITCMLFFQLALLAGYIYAHLLINHLKPVGQRLIHVVFICASLLLLPVTPDRDLRIMENVDPVLHLLILLITSVGLPYFLLSTTSPLLQSWYAGQFRKAIPYRLFALSNFSSLLGLMAYPIIVEPYLTLSGQSTIWSWSYALFALTCIIAALMGMKHRHVGKPNAESMISESALEATPPGAGENLMWFLLSTCSSVMLLSTTNYITQNVASIPFLWILPLALYLLSFTLCFDRSGWYSRRWYVWIITLAVGLMTIVIAKFEHNFDMTLSILLFCSGLFLCCMFCHGELAARKPAPGFLTGFYLMIAVGGAAGGALVGIVVPMVLSGPFELSMALNACALLLLAVHFRKRPLTDIVCSALVIGTLGCTVYFIHSFTTRAHLLARDFYGAMKVDIVNEGKEKEYRLLIHGTVAHGIQFTDPELRNGHFSYYSESSGIGLAMNNLRPGPRHIGIIGLGAGAISSYAREGDIFRFYEIDPLVEKVARQEFTYLSDCRGKVDIVIGDGRLSLEKEDGGKFDLLVVDAFSSDAIPVHLLTIEAMKLYFSRLKPDGILAVHISNRHLNLALVMERASSELNVQSVFIRAPGNSEKMIYTSDWVLMAAGNKLYDIFNFKKVAPDHKAQARIGLWTDDYSNLVRILRW